MDQRHWLQELESEIESRHLLANPFYFEVHRRVDIEHAQAEREILQAGARSPAERERVHTAVQESAAALRGLLDGVRRAYGVN